MNPRTAALSLVLGGAAMVSAPAQESGGEPGAQVTSTGPAQETPAPAPTALPMPQRAGGRILVPSVLEHRQGQRAAVMTQAEVVDLHLDQVDLDADPLLKVNGEVITQQDLRRSLCLLAATNELDQFITYILAKDIRRQLEAAGTDVEQADVSEEEIRRNFEQQKEMAGQMMGMDPDEWERQIKETFGWDRYVEFQKVQIGFEKLLLPDPPPGFLKEQEGKFELLRKDYDVALEEWKKVTAEGRQAAEAAGTTYEPPPAPVPPVPDADLSFLPPRALELLGEQFAPLVKDTYARGQEIHPLLRQGIVGSIKRTLLEKTDVVFFPDLGPEMGEEVLFTVNGEKVNTSDIYTLIAPRLTPAVRRLALRELVTLRAVDHALQERGFLPTSEEAEQRYNEMAKKYEGSLIPLQQAVMLRGFPNLFHYKNYFRRKAAYRRMVEETTPEEQLRDHFGKSGALFFENGSVDGIVLFIPGETEEIAHAATREALGRVEQGTPFAQVAAEVGKLPPSNSHRLGVFRGMVRNRLRQLLQESEFTAFATGYSMADEVFYAGVEDEIVGPVFRDYGDKVVGDFAVKIERYYSGGQQKTYDESKENVLEDYADITFPRFASEALAIASIELP